ncbi:MAG: TadE/TadG family type IV pilus assembly protein, partial [Hyphomicrobiaceae bacterium]
MLRRDRGGVDAFLKDRSGAAMVEFAMTGFMFLMAILWLVEIGLVYMTTLELEAATKDVARIVRTDRLSEVTTL